MRKIVHGRKNRPRSVLYMGIVSLISLLLLILFVPPTTTFSLFGFQISILILFFPLLIVFLFSLPRYFLASKKHGVLLAIFGAVYGGLLLLELRHFFFLIILLALFFTLELLFTSSSK